LGTSKKSASKKTATIQARLEEICQAGSALLNQCRNLLRRSAKTLMQLNAISALHIQEIEEYQVHAKRQIDRIARRILPMNCVTLMSSGRIATIHYGEFGAIEFVHTKKRPASLASDLIYDERCHLWLASEGLAIRDMKAARRSLDLVDWEVVNESL